MVTMGVHKTKWVWPQVKEVMSAPRVLWRSQSFHQLLAMLSFLGMEVQDHVYVPDNNPTQTETVFKHGDGICVGSMGEC